MGYWKQRELETDGLRHITAEVAVRAGLLARCPHCREVYDPLTWLYEKAYRLANYLVTAADELVEPFNGDRRQLTDLIKEIGKWYPNACSCGASGRR